MFGATSYQIKTVEVLMVEHSKKQPVVFMFQPSRFETVTGERIKEWEQLMRDKVGLPKLAGGFADGGSCTVCNCPDADDCDVD